MSPAAPVRARWETLRACGLLALVTVCVFRSWLFVGQALYWGDFGLYFQPLLHFQREQLLQGTLPLWNPTLFCGQPFAGNPQAWPLYPATLLLPMLPASQFLTVSCVLHIWLAGVFCYLFLRHGALGVGEWPSLLGAVSYMLGGYFVAKAQYPNMLQALAWLPLLLYFSDRLALRPGARAAAWLGAALGLQLLGSHAQVTLYTIYFMGVLGVFQLWGQSRLAWLRAASWGLVSLVLGLGISCGQWLPVLDVRRSAGRQQLTLAHVDRLHLPAVEWSNFAFPSRFGSPLHGDWAGAGPMWETACYAGTLTLVLALLSVLGRRREAAFWLGVFFVSVWLALGASGGLFRIAYAVVPGMKYFHDPARLLIGAAVALPVLGALGLQALLSRLSPRAAMLMGWACVALTALDLGHYDRGLYPTQPISQLETLGAISPVARALRADPMLASGQGRILTLGDLEADTQFLSWTGYEQNAPGYLPRLADTLLPNQPGLVGLSMAGGYEPLAFAGSAHMAADAVSALQNGPRENVLPLLNAMAVRAVITYSSQPPHALWGLTPILKWDDLDGVHHGMVYENRQFVPRAVCYSTHGIQPIQILSDTPDRVSLQVPPVAQDVRLALADTALPGWQARRDGHPVSVLKANEVFRAVDLPKSLHAQNVVLTYRPASFQIGLYITLLTVSSLTAGGVFFLRRRTP